MVDKYSYCLLDYSMSRKYYNIEICIYKHTTSIPGFRYQVNSKTKKREYLFHIPSTLTIYECRLGFIKVSQKEQSNTRHLQYRLSM